MQIEFLPLIFRYDNKSSYNEGIISIVYLLLTLDQPDCTCCLSMLRVSVWKREEDEEEKEKKKKKKKKRRRACVFVCVHVRRVDRLQDRTGTSSLGPERWGREPMSGVKRAGSGGVYLQNDTAVTLPGLLSVPLTWENTHTHTQTHTSSTTGNTDPAQVLS